ncbi:MAG: hypothetical protein JSS66_00585 [Armatimonadetes bacterium]|nr:hypothetical protein [Armatimonadota bacterium]
MRIRWWAWPVLWLALGCSGATSFLVRNDTDRQQDLEVKVPLERDASTVRLKLDPFATSKQPIDGGHGFLPPATVRFGPGDPRSGRIVTVERPTDRMKAGSSSAHTFIIVVTDKDVHYENPPLWNQVLEDPVVDAGLTFAIYCGLPAVLIGLLVVWLRKRNVAPD